MKKILLPLLALVLLVGVTNNILAQTVTVAGAGSAEVNGTYTYLEIYGGRNFYNGPGGTYVLYWETAYSPAAWKIADGGGHGIYLNIANTPLPPSGGWQQDNTYFVGGIPPFPTLTGDVDLPVQLTSFSGSSNNNLVNLRWTTATEINNVGFDVERNANNSWMKIGFVPGNGTSNTPHWYSYTGEKLGAGTSSYRLKQIDHDGGFVYSQEISVQAGGGPKVFALNQNYPNPFNPTTTMQFTVPGDGRATLVVYNVLGQEAAILFDGLAAAGEYHQATFDGSHFASGIYFARLQFAGKTLVRKLLMTK